MDSSRWGAKIIVLALAILVMVVIVVLVINDRYDAPKNIRPDNTPSALRQASDEPSPPSSGVSSLSKTDSVSDVATAAKTKVDTSERPASVDFELIVLSPQDQKAVILDSNGQTLLVTVGDQLGEGRHEVLQVTSDKLVLRHSETGATLWLFESDSGEKGRLQEFSSQFESSDMSPDSSLGQSVDATDK